MNRELTINKFRSEADNSVSTVVHVTQSLFHVLLRRAKETRFNVGGLEKDKCHHQNEFRLQYIDKKNYHDENESKIKLKMP